MRVSAASHLAQGRSPDVVYQNALKPAAAAAAAAAATKATLDEVLDPPEWPALAKIDALLWKRVASSAQRHARLRDFYQNKLLPRVLPSDHPLRNWDLFRVRSTQELSVDNLQQKTVVKPMLVVKTPAKVEQMGPLIKAVRAYLQDQTGADPASTTQMVRVEGVCSVQLLQLRVTARPQLRFVDLACAPGLTDTALELLRKLPQLHEVHLNLCEAHRTLNVRRALHRLSLDVSLPWATLRLFWCGGLDAVGGRGDHLPLFQLPFLRALEFYGLTVAADGPPLPIGEQWLLRPAEETAFYYRVRSSALPPEENDKVHVALCHAHKPRAPGVVPHSRQQIIVPV